jgi:ketosteroid isomerase-like protein
VKRCPTCNKTFTDQNLSFCTEDGTPLLSPLSSLDTPEDEATVVRPSKGDSETGAPRPSEPSSASEAHSVPPYQPPGSYTPRDYAGQSKRRTWPWIVGILAIVFVVFAGLGIAAAILIPKMMRATNTNSRNLNANIQRNDSNPNLNGRNSNPGSNSADGNENSNDSSAAEDTTPPPTDEEKVLQDLTDLEHEWTVANINADKKKLDRILADDYVGEGADGKPQGKAEYLRTATRDTAIQKWDFEDLKLSLKGDRAALTGIIRLEIKDQRGQNQNLAFRFTDKFVWRDGRWQATGSVVTPLKEGTAV